MHSFNFQSTSKYIKNFIVANNRKIRAVKWCKNSFSSSVAVKSHENKASEMKTAQK